MNCLGEKETELRQKFPEVLRTQTKGVPVVDPS